jgi:hypothetical protein
LFDIGGIVEFKTNIIIISWKGKLISWYIWKITNLALSTNQLDVFPDIAVVDQLNRNL